MKKENEKNCSNRSCQQGHLEAETLIRFQGEHSRSDEDNGKLCRESFQLGRNHH